MAEPTSQLRDLARRITDVYLRHMPIGAALLAGSGARGDADRYSEIRTAETAKSRKVEMSFIGG